MVLALIGLGLAADGRGAPDGVSGVIAADYPEGSLATSLIAAFRETAGSAAAYAQGRRDCQIKRGNNRRLGRLRLCINRVPWNFANTSDNNFDPVITPDGRFIAFASRDNLDGNIQDVDPAGSEDPDNPPVEASRDIFLVDLQTGDPPRRVSVDEEGQLAPSVPDPNPDDGDTPQLADSDSPAISADGRLVAFVTNGAFLDEDDNRSGDVYLKDLSTGALTLVSATGPNQPAFGGVPLNQSGSSFPALAMSDNGRFVAFMTTTALDRDRDHNDTLDLYVKNLRNGRFFLASLNAQGEAAGVANPSEFSESAPTPTDPAVDISGNGRFVAFTTLAALDPLDMNAQADVYVWNRRRPFATPVLASGGGQPPEDFDPADGALSSSPALSFSGRFVAFESLAALVDDDSNEVSDVYRYDRKKPSLRRISVDGEGREAAVDGSFDPAISASGRFVGFSSAASDLVIGDTNLGATDRQNQESINTPFPEDIFVKDVRTGAITRASLDEDGIESDGTSFSPSLSADGRVIAFVTEDSGLLESSPDNERQGDSVVVTGVGFQLPPLLEIPGDAAGAVRIERNFEVSPGGGIFVPEARDFIPLDFALRNQIEQAGDQDWFAVALFPNRTYTIDLEGAATEQGTLNDPLIRLFQDTPDGPVEIDSDDDRGVPLNARLIYEAPAEGTFYISAEGVQGSTGTYRLLVRESEAAPTAAAAR